MTKDRDISDFLDGYQAAWSGQDIDAIVEFFADELAFDETLIKINVAEPNKCCHIVRCKF